MTRPFKTNEERFWSKVDKSPGHGPDGDCWIWSGARDQDGYGQFMERIAFKTKYKQWKAHRFSYYLKYQIIPARDLFTCHYCDWPSCIRPDHLFLGTPKANAQDRDAKGRQWDKRKINEAGTSWCTMCKQFLETSNFYADKSRWDGRSKKCKKCSLEYNANRYKVLKGKSEK